MTSDGQALLAAILAAPDDDAPRLIYADWLDEQNGEMPCSACDRGDTQGSNKLWMSSCATCEHSGFVPNGFAERAEFIRCQVEMAGLLVGSGEWRMGVTYVFADAGKDCHGNGYHVRKDNWERFTALRRRERELLDWLAGAFHDSEDVQQAWGVLGLWSATHVTWEWRRGFVDEFTCTAADWLAHADQLYWHPDLARPCPETAQPIRKVRLTTCPHYDHDWDAKAYRLDGRQWRSQKELCRPGERPKDWRAGGNDEAVPRLLAVEWPAINFELPRGPLRLRPDLASWCCQYQRISRSP